MKHENKDSMAPIAMVFGVVVLLAAVIFLVTRLISVYEQNSTKGEINNEAQVLANIQPVGEVATGEAAGPVARSGKEIVEETLIEFKLITILQEMGMDAVTSPVGLEEYNCVISTI